MSLARYAPARPQALLLGATSPYFSEYSLADVKSGEGWRRLQSGMRAFLEWDIPQSAGLDVTDWFLCRQLANDPQALLACLEALYATSYAEFLPHNTVPCLLFVGTADAGAYPQTKRAAKVMGKAELLEIPNRGHGELFRVLEALPVNPRLH